MNETITLYQDGNAFCCALGSYPGCTSPEVFQVWADSPKQALIEFANKWDAK